MKTLRNLILVAITGTAMLTLTSCVTNGGGKSCCAKSSCCKHGMDSCCKKPGSACCKGSSCAR